MQGYLQWLHCSASANSFCTASASRSAEKIETTNGFRQYIKSSCISPHSGVSKAVCSGLLWQKGQNSCWILMMEHFLSGYDHSVTKNRFRHNVTVKKVLMRPEVSLFGCHTICSICCSPDSASSPHPPHHGAWRWQHYAGKCGEQSATFCKRNDLGCILFSSKTVNRGVAVKLSIWPLHCTGVPNC